MCTGKLSHRACTRSHTLARTRIPHTHTHTCTKVHCERSQGYRTARKVNPAEWFQQFSLCSGYAHVRLPQLPIYFLSLSLSAIFDPYPSLGLLHEEPYTSSASKKERERATRERNEKRKTEEIYRLQESPWFPTLVKLPRLRTFPTIDSHSFSPSPTSFILLQSCSLLPTFAAPPSSRLLVSSKLDGPMKFAVRHFYLASLSPPLSLSVVERERSLSDSPSLGERPIPLEDPLPPRQKFRADAREKRREERKKAKCRFRTILERSISYERCRSPLAYKTFIKSPTKWTGGRRRRCTRGRQAAAGCQMILKLFGTVSTTNPFSIRSHHQPPPVGKFSDADGGVAWLKVIE